MESQTEDGNGEEGFPEGGQQNKGVGGAQLHNQVNWYSCITGYGMGAAAQPGERGG